MKECRFCKDIRDWVDIDVNVNPKAVEQELGVSGAGVLCNLFQINPPQVAKRGRVKKIVWPETIEDREGGSIGIE